jgi:hypothetical protein
VVFKKMARRIMSDYRWDAGVGYGGGEPGSSAEEWRSLDVALHSRGQAYPSKGVEVDTISEEDSRGERSGTV